MKKLFSLLAALCCVQHSLSVPNTVSLSVDSIADTADEEAMDDNAISTTRANHTTADKPFRVEVITGEELGEKANVKPVDIHTTLNENTGIQAHQTSVTSGIAMIRVQGQDVQVAQMLRHAFPTFVDAASGLGRLPHST